MKCLVFQKQHKPTSDEAVRTDFPSEDAQLMVRRPQRPFRVGERMSQASPWEDWHRAEEMCFSLTLYFAFPEELDFSVPQSPCHNWVCSFITTLESIDEIIKVG